jgi:hypothetical protein
MDPILVLYARGAVNDFIKHLCDISIAMGYSLWSLSGNPCVVGMRLPAIARRICILNTPDIPADHIRPEHVIGTVHLVQTSHLPQQVRISFHLEDLAGKPLIQSGQPALQRFSAKTYMLLEVENLLVEENGPNVGTGPFPINNAQPDTGPL